MCEKFTINLDNSIAAIITFKGLGTLPAEIHATF